MRKKIDKPYIKLLICIACALVVGLVSTLGYGFFRYSKITDNKGFSAIDAKNISSTISENSPTGEYVFSTPGILQIQFPEKTYIARLRYTYDTDMTMSFGIKVYCTNDDGSESERMIDDNVFIANSLSVVDVHQKVDRIEIIYGDAQSHLVVSDFSIDNTFKFNPIILTVAVLIVFLAMYLILFRKENAIHLPKTVFVTVFIMGMILMIVEPPTISGWDEEIHFARAYDLGVGKSGEATASIVQYIEENMPTLNFNHVANYEERVNMLQSFDQLSKTMGTRIDEYSFEISSVGYIFQAMALKIGTGLHLPFGITWYLGKLMNLLLYAAGMAGIVYILPIGKYLMTVVALIPTMLFLATTYTYDVTVTVFVMLALAIWFREILNKDTKFTYKWRVLMCLFMFIGCCPKAVYAPLILCALFIPKEKFYSKKDCYIFRAVIIVVCLLILSTFVLPTLIAPSQTGDLRGGNTSVSGQLGFVFSHPFTYAINLLKCMQSNFIPFVLDSEGLTNMAYNGRVQLLSVHIVILIAVLLTDRFNSDRYRFTAKYRIVMACGIFAAAAFIWTALYLSFTEVGLPTINGVQGRYYFPFLFFIYMFFAPNKIAHTYKKENYQTVVLGMSALVLFVEMFSMFIRTGCL